MDVAFKTGALVRYRPTERTRGWEPHDSKYGLVIGAVYRVLSTKPDGYLCLFEGHEGSHWTNFQIVDDGYPGPVSEVIPWPQSGANASGLP